MRPTDGMRMTGSDHEDHLTIMRAADQIVEALPALRPRKMWKNRRRVHFYDLRGKVDAVPGLAVACMFPLGRFAVSVREPGSPFGPVLLCPGLPSEWFNRTVIESQTGIHHELAHIILGHEIDSAYERTGPAYFNHPYELTAYLHQSLAAAARKGGWDEGDGDAFRAFVLNEAPRPFRLALTPANRLAFEGRIDAVWGAWMSDPERAAAPGSRP